MTGTLDKREATKEIRISFSCLFGPEAFSGASRKRKGKDQTLTSLRVTLRLLIVFPFSHVLEKMCAERQTGQFHRKQLGDSLGTNNMQQGPSQ